jgi:tRNA A37 methylthiotransferase MiaB
VPDQTIKTRTSILRELGEAKRSRFVEANLGRRHEVLVENKRDRRTGRLKGLSANYLTFVFDGPDTLMNHIVGVQAEASLPDGRLTGSFISPTG